MGVCGCGATQVVTVSFARSTFIRRPLAALQMKMEPPSEPEHTKSLRSPMSDTCKATMISNACTRSRVLCCLDLASNSSQAQLRQTLPVCGWHH